MGPLELGDRETVLGSGSWPLGKEALESVAGETEAPSLSLTLALTEGALS